jgi:hypothetical protein
MVGCHNDNNPANCRLDNLRWDTQKGNLKDKVQHGTHPAGEKNGSAKLTATQVRAIRADPRGAVAISRDFGVSHAAVSRIKLRETWTHIH